MYASSTRAVLDKLFVYGLVTFVLHTATGALVVGGVVDSVASLTSATSNAVANMNVVQTLTDAGTALGDGALKLLTGNKVEDASSYTTFLFFSRDSGDNFTRVNTGDLQLLLDAGFDRSKDTKLLVHGWSNNGTDTFSTVMKEALLENEDLNVFTVDWPEMAQKAYSVAYTAVPYVGAHTASFVDFLVDVVGVDISKIHIIGFSLGAHISGTAGEHVTCGKLPRITGLDPAGPLFTSSAEGRLDPSDAEFVDVIHTTAGVLGYADPLGTVDFYPNGGYAPQPGCGTLDPFCSHNRAHLFYAESISSDGFVAKTCDSWKSFEKDNCENSSSTIMGYNVNKRTEGVFYLETNSESPFAKY